jgi:opacity protein-like surface antigen
MFMEPNKRTMTSILAVAALAMGLLAAAPASAATVTLEGVVSGGPEPECVLVKDHDGNSFVLEGTGWYGVIGNDYVSVQGAIIPENRCGVTSGIQVSNVSTIWRDNTRKVVVYESKEGSFADWVRAHREREWREWEQAHHIPPPPPQQQ